MSLPSFYALKENINQTGDKFYGIEIPMHLGENYSEVLKKYWGDVIYNTFEWFKKAQECTLKSDASFISLYFNLQEPDDNKKAQVLKNYKEIIEKIQDIAQIPIMLRLSSYSKWDIELTGAIMPILKNSCAFATVQATNYKEIIALNNSLKAQHCFVMRTPIDINLTKELNILSTDEGLEQNKIFIDPEMGCIGYGIDYGYSIIERICLAKNQGDKMLDMPLIVFVGEESYKAKESKSTDFSASWGELEMRAKCWEVSTTASLFAAGANVAVVWHPDTIKSLKNDSEAQCH